MDVLFITFIALALIFSIGGFLVIRDSIQKKGKWGINQNSTSCSNCGQKLPIIRLPKSIKQALWGGWTCTNCGSELDKWGKVIAN